MAQDQIFTKLEAVKDEASFLEFVAALIKDREAVDGLAISADGFQGEWANNSMADYLERALAWAKDSDFGIRPGPKTTNPWRLFADFFWAGRGYE